MSDKLPKNAALQDDGTVIYTLSKPVRLSVENGQDQELAELTFHELTAGDLIDSSTGGNGAKISLDMLQRSTGQQGLVGEKLLRKMSARDYIACQKIVASFLDDGVMTGA